MTTKAIPSLLNSTHKELNGFLNILPFLGVIQLFRSIISALIMGLASPLFGIISFVSSVLLLAGLIITIYCVHKWGVYLYFFAQAATCIAVAFVAPEYGIDTLKMSIGGCILFSLLLCLRKNGKSAWNVLFSSQYVERS